jgi:hypothetical protein
MYFFKFYISIVMVVSMAMLSSAANVFSMVVITDSAARVPPAIHNTQASAMAFIPNESMTISSFNSAFNTTSGVYSGELPFYRSAVVAQSFIHALLTPSAPVTLNLDWTFKSLNLQVVPASGFAYVNDQTELVAETNYFLLAKSDLLKDYFSKLNAASILFPELFFGFDGKNNGEKTRSQSFYAQVRTILSVAGMSKSNAENIDKPNINLLFFLGCTILFFHSFKRPGYKYARSISL